MNKEKVYEEVFASVPSEDFDPATLEIEWHNPFDEDKVTILNALHTDEKSFMRLSQEEHKMISSISQDVAWLSRHSAGIQLRFKTNSRIVKLMVTNYDNFEMRNMTFMGCSGVDSYSRTSETAPFKFHSSAFPCFIDCRKWFGYPVYFYDNVDREIILNLPLYNGVFILEIGVEKGCYLKAADRPNKKKILCYGTSILQGCAASRPGINITNQVSRHFDQEIYNFGFSGAANLEKEMAEIISKVQDLELMTIDCEANAGMSSLLYERLDDFLNIIFKAQPNLPIILFNRDRSHHDDNSIRYPKIRIFNTEYMKELTKKYADLGYKIYFFDKFNLFDDTEVTIEGLHPTDVGLNKIAKFYINTITEIKKTL